MEHHGIWPRPYQVEDWIQERVQQLRAWSPLGNLNDYLKHLWKHQAFEAEVQAHEQVMTSVAKVTPASAQPKVLMAKVSDKKKGAERSPIPVSQQGEGLLRQSHPGTGEVSQKLKALWELWEKLRQAVTLQGQALEDRRSFLEFLQRVDLAEAWIQEKVKAPSAEQGIWRLGAEAGDQEPKDGVGKSQARSSLSP